MLTAGSPVDGVLHQPASAQLQVLAVAAYFCASVELVRAGAQVQVLAGAQVIESQTAAPAAAGQNVVLEAHSAYAWSRASLQRGNGEQKKL